MRLLFIGEYSNVHWTLAEGLRQLGHEVTVISNGDFWKDYPRDIDVSRPDGRLSGLRLLTRIYTLLPRLRGYDVVQLINPIFFELKAERLFSIYRYLRHHNKQVVLGAFGMDWYWVNTCTHKKPLRYSDFNIGDRLRNDPSSIRERNDWLGTSKERLNIMIANDCDAIVTGLYEYDICYRPYFPNKTHFIPFPIKMPESFRTERCLPSAVAFFIGISRSRSQYKGTDIMLDAAKELQRNYHHRMKLTIAEGLPFSKYQQRLEGSDAILDQLYSYTPSMNPLMAMSKGVICIGGGEPENYEILNETELRPIINVQPSYESVYHEMEQLILHPERITELKRQSIEYVRRHHDYLSVARRYEQLYLSLQ